MDQERIGRFISMCRKEKNMTQVNIIWMFIFSSKYYKV